MTWLILVMMQICALVKPFEIGAVAEESSATTREGQLWLSYISIERSRHARVFRYAVALCFPSYIPVLR